MTTRHKISTKIRQQIAGQAGQRCSYCLSPMIAGVPMVIDHIIPLSAGGSDSLDNYCLACYRCNEFKWAKQTSLDPISGNLVLLFNPNQQKWVEHFAWSEDSLQVIGLTSTGRATIKRLRLNDERFIQARRIWRLAGLHPPLD